MKRIVICCDGTWRRLDDATSTNVGWIAKSVLPTGPDGVLQLVVHLDGVGAGRGATRVGRTLDRYLGGAFGMGLDDSIVEAYRLLVFNYEPGDEIYLFGYSRGAFTARSLGGLIRKCGILSRSNIGRIGDALRLYRDRDPANGPEQPPSLMFRATYARQVALGEAEIAWRRANLPERDHADVHPLRIRYVGVWDTVGALGVPGFVLASPVFNRRHRFHDTMLSRHVAAARHAVATDERRRSFEPTLWTNFDDLNDGMRGGDACYQQRWFPGVHGAVGGGGGDCGLSSLALLWVLEGAERQGLAVDPEAKATRAGEADPMGRLVPYWEIDAPLSRLRRLGAADRAGPARGDAEALSDPLVARWRSDKHYRPGPLRRVSDLIDPPVASASRPEPAATDAARETAMT